MNVTDYITGKQWFGTFPQTRIDYDSNSNPIYIGLAARGKASSDADWVIIKFTLDANNNVTLIQVSSNNQIWDNRATVTFS